MSESELPHNDDDDDNTDADDFDEDSNNGDGASERQPAAKTLKVRDDVSVASADSPASADSAASAKTVSVKSMSIKSSSARSVKSNSSKGARRKHKTMSDKSDNESSAFDDDVVPDLDEEVEVAEDIIHIPDFQPEMTVIVSDSMTRACKCHGVSGSCSVKTCWRSLPTFDSIGAALKDRYALAVEVKRKRIKKEKVLVPIHKGKTSFRTDELVYYEKSPDYCSPDVKTGSVGTEGRLCEAESRGPGNCDSMCCGRGHDNFTMEITERCECKYYWCCYVKCNTCLKVLHLNQCR